ncbi:zinc ribbon domain-containing protein [Litorihabitans aurantiacus]|uniref:CT398-like coiled coil hairpin domain-containing protein n=1 Tax=Litorihabitans aurantiacus TaxID=1930061 RepID=A0AA37XEK2_9MICO|nr:hypothetical protein [Litorihabitans aurantiacus]GMA31622.1 hypothetical protein GCM10025875_16140 [Litorihabitans aurantiacus]
MTTAPATDQRRLLDVQALDTQLAKVAHARRSHPTLATLTELAGRAEDLRRSSVLAESVVNDHRRAVAKAEADVEQVRTRAQRDQGRLDSGAFGAKDSVAVMAELEQLARRQSVLEDVEIEAMEGLEGAEGELSAIREQIAAIETQVAAATAERDAAFTELDAQLEDVTARRGVAATGIDEALLALYEKVRASNGGLAVLGLRGIRTEPLQLDLSLSEVSAIKAAPKDAVLRDEENGYILVRLDD